MARLFTDAELGRVAWGAAFGGAAIAGGTAFMAFTGARPFMWLPSWAGVCILIGLPTTLLVGLAFRITRGAYAAPPSSAFAKRSVLASGVIQLAFLAAALILLPAWLTALALRAEISTALLQALVLTIILFFFARLLCLSVVNLAIAIQGPGEDSAAS